VTHDGKNRKRGRSINLLTTSFLFAFWRALRDFLWASSGQAHLLPTDQLDSDTDCPEPPYSSDPVCGDACEVVPFELLSPSNGATLSNPPTFEWSSGSYDAFLFYSIFNYTGLGYYTVPFWLNVISFQMPVNWWNMLATDAPCIWAVLGYNTSTSEYELSDVWWFSKVP